MHPATTVEGNMGTCRGAVTSIINASSGVTYNDFKGVHFGVVTSTLTQETCMLIITFAREYKYCQNAQVPQNILMNIVIEGSSHNTDYSFTVHTVHVHMYISAGHTCQTEMYIWTCTSLLDINYGLHQCK